VGRRAQSLYCAAFAEPLARELKFMGRGAADWRNKAVAPYKTISPLPVRERTRGEEGGGAGQSGAGAMLTTSGLGPSLGAGLVQRMLPRRLSAAVGAFDNVMVMCS